MIAIFYSEILSNSPACSAGSCRRCVAEVDAEALNRCPPKWFYVVLTSSFKLELLMAQV